MGDKLMRIKISQGDLKKIKARIVELESKGLTYDAAYERAVSEVTKKPIEMMKKEGFLLDVGAD